MLLPIAAAAVLVLALRPDLRNDIAAAERAETQKADLAPVLSAMMKRHPAEPWFPYLAGADRVRQRQPGPALRYLNRALQLEPRGWRYHLAACEALLLAGPALRDQALGEARTAYRLSQLDPRIPATLVRVPGMSYATGLGAFVGDDPVLTERVARFLDETHRDEDGEAMARHLVELRPDDDAHRLLARLLVRRRKFDEALTQAALLPAADPAALLVRVRALDGLGRNSDANALLAGLDPKVIGHTPEVVFAIAERSIASGHPDIALTWLARVGRDGLAPEALGQLYELRGRALEASGRVREGILDLVAAVRIDPSEHNRLALGETYERAGLMRQAWFSYRDAARAANASGDAKARLARVQATLGRGVTVSGSGATQVLLPWQAEDAEEGAGEGSGAKAGEGDE